MALDNRSRVLSVTAETPSPEAAEKLKEWYESTGGHVVPSENGSLIVRYPNREMAERVSCHQALGGMWLTHRHWRWALKRWMCLSKRAGIPKYPLTVTLRRPKRWTWMPGRLGGC